MTLDFGIFPHTPDMLRGVEKSQTLQKVHLLACGSVKMIFYPLVTRVSMTIYVV